MTQEQQGWWGSEYWYYDAYLDAYLMYLKPQIIKEISDLIFRENPFMKAIRLETEAKRRQQWKKWRKS